ncbi:MAG: sugar ABC transporter ATP-binding protein [Thiobacillus sp. 65-69]|nr:ABC transporter ATP-binding protein [Thiobacillus sp.]ODU90896.1 MAG: sugar ABC transporter ATP-binding protein [Thiobacillus sp. SCN 65-179]OJW35678.1 MAG: sugar ABC transporter ATP-binding protein [Thiobacillus sp. 65-69]
MSKPSVIVDGVSKKFGLSLKNALKYGLIDSGRRLIGLSNSQQLRMGEFWALHDVSFSLEPGDALGIMGVNGSGKTTLLRILNGTYGPDNGNVMLRGRVGALIAAGAGFSPMLSGRENIYISGTLLGMTPREIKNRFDEIVSFAGLEEFIDMPVRNYSSGMSVRLGFAIAVIGTPEILLVDEVLAVGDISFQKKCFERILALKNQGTTILLVSHAIGAIWAVCDKGLFLHKGRPAFMGDIESVCKAYDEQNSRSSQAAMAREKATVCTRHSEGHDSCPPDELLPEEYGHGSGGTGDVLCTRIRVLSASTGEETKEIEFGEPFIIEYQYVVRNRIRDPIFRSSLDAVHYKFIVSLDSYEQGCTWDMIEPGNYTLRVRVENQALRPGLYSINNSVISKGIGVHLFYRLSAASFVVRHPQDRFLYSNEQAVCFFPASMDLTRT